MRAGVLSDTHGDLEIAKVALTQMGKIDLLLHAGDHYRDALALAKTVPVPVHAVVGNCDWDFMKPVDVLLEIDNQKIWLTHGHKYGVKSANNKLLTEAIKNKIDIVVYGHTHIPIAEFRQGVLLFNPGSVARLRGKRGATYGVIEIRQQEIMPDIFDII